MNAIELDGVLNFRDFGGAPAGEGRRVRTGRLYRSGHHATPSDADLERIAALDIALYVDLRRPPERANAPARRPANGRVLEHQGPEVQATPPHLTFLAEPDASPRRVIEQMIIGYRGYPFDPHYVAVYRDYFALLTTLDGPVLVNCHAGKDRTGFLCALTLTALGVHRDDVFADYLASNRHNRADERIGEMLLQFEETHGHRPSEALLRQMLSVEPAYLDAAFDAIVEAHGTTEAYLADVAGVTPGLREQMRTRLLV